MDAEKLAVREIEPRGTHTNHTKDNRAERNIALFRHGFERGYSVAFKGFVG
jgi:hypothetical protein